MANEMGGSARETRRPRVSAEKRREQILAAATTEFSRLGLHGASTMTIAERASVSQPNMFRLFSTKRELFIAALEQVVEQIKQRMISSGEANPANPLTVMADRWRDLLENRELMLMLLQGYAACSDEEVRNAMHRASIEMFSRIEQMPGIGPETARRFYAEGMYLTIAAAMDFPAIGNKDTEVRRFLGC